MNLIGDFTLSLVNYVYLHTNALTDGERQFQFQITYEQAAKKRQRNEISDRMNQN